MCGINGFNFKNQNLILKMNEATRHRGPDGSSFFIDENISFGHNLLAIMETPLKALQPLVSSDRNFSLVFNGEIYNYLALRAELENKGEKFSTNGDTEVLFKGLIREGIDFIEKLDGMFAFAFYSRQKSKIYLARDYGGMKPLYYYHKAGRFIFSSELRGLLVHSDVRRQINRNSLSIYFSLGYVPGPETLIKDVYKVCPGQFLTYDLLKKDLKTSWYGYKRPEPMIEKFNPDYFRKIIGDSVARHTMGLRPFGLYLSGGLDSTVILHELSKIVKEKIKTYTTSFITKDVSLNQDAMLAKRLSSDYQIEHHELVVTEKDFIDSLEATIETIEEPRYNFSLPAYWLLAQEAAKDIVVVLNGNGGDELFLGYPRYLEAQTMDSRYANLPAGLLDFWYSAKLWKNKSLPFGQLLHLNNLPEKWAYLNNINRFELLEFAKIFKFVRAFNQATIPAYLKLADYPFIKNPLLDKVNAMGEFDRLLWLADEDFLRTDKITMHFGMEGRFPFLAKEIVEYANALSSKEKLKNKVLKSVSRIAYQNILPDYIINKQKTGWYAPAVEWMHGDLGEMVRNVLSGGYYSSTSGLFNLDYLRINYIERVNRFTQSNVKRFLPIFAFQVWARLFKIEI